MKDEVEVYFPQKIYVLIKEGDKEIRDNYILSKINIKKKVKSDLAKEFNKYYIVNSNVVIKNSDEEQRLKLSMNFLNRFLEIYIVDTLKNSLEKKKIIKNFLIITNPLSIYLNKKV